MKKSLLGCLVAFLVIGAMGCGSHNNKIVSARFDAEIRRRYSAIESYGLLRDGDRLVAEFRANDNLKPAVVKGSIEWAVLFFAESKRDYFRDLMKKKGVAQAGDWDRFKIIDITFYVNNEKIVEWRLDENKLGSPESIIAYEHTNIPLESKILHPSGIKDFREMILQRYPDINDVVLERLLLFPDLHRVVKFYSSRQFAAETVAQTREHVIADLLQRPAFQQEQIICVIIEYYEKGNRTHQVSWDNLARTWIEGDWSKHVFHGNPVR